MENEILLLSCRIEMRTLRSDFVISGYGVREYSSRAGKRVERHSWRRDNDNTHLQAHGHMVNLAFSQGV